MISQKMFCKKITALILVATTIFLLFAYKTVFYKPSVVVELKTQQAIQLQLNFDKFVISKNVAAKNAVQKVFLKIPQGTDISKLNLHVVTAPVDFSIENLYILGLRTKTIIRGEDFLNVFFSDNILKTEVVNFATHIQSNQAATFISIPYQFNAYKKVLKSLKYIVFEPIMCVLIMIAL